MKKLITSLSSQEIKFNYKDSQQSVELHNSSVTAFEARPRAKCPTKNQL